MSLVGKLAPDFKTAAVINGNEIVEGFTLSQFRGKYVVLFFYPMDFTFVCPTEILSFQKHLASFEARNTVVLGCSVDSKFSHRAWLNTPREDGGIVGVTFPLVADFDKTISENYGVLGGNYEYNEEGLATFTGKPFALRGTFLIDKEGKVWHELINQTDLGRSTEEALRMVDALQHFEEFGEVCPADWEKGDDAFKGNKAAVVDYLTKHN